MALDLRDKIDAKNREITAARALMDKENPSAEDRAQADKHLDAAERIGKEIEQRKRLDGVEKSVVAGIETIVREADKDSELRQFCNVLQKRDMFDGVEGRDVMISSDELGGYWVPSIMQDAIRKVEDAATFFTSLTNVITGVPPEADLGIPTLETDPADFDWTSEVASVSADTTMRAGKRTLKTNLSSKLLKVSIAMLQRRPNVEQTIVDRLTYKQAVTKEKAGLTGTGSGQWLGVFTASTLGVPTTRDVSTGNTTTAITADNLIRTKMSLRPVYWGRSAWIAHQDFYLQVALLKDGEQRYLFKLAENPNQPDMLLGRPAYVSEFAPNTFTASQYVAAIGDFKQYDVAVSNMSVQRLNEKYADTNQVGFIGREWSDGMPVFGEAFARVQLAAA